MKRKRFHWCMSLIISLAFMFTFVPYQNVFPVEVTESEMLIVTVTPGTKASSTKVTIKEAATSKFVVNITDNEVTKPNEGDAVPTGGNVVDSYASGADITNGVVVDKYLQVYDVDGEGKVVKFYQKKLVSEDIKKADGSSEPSGNWQDEGIPATSFAGGSGTKADPYQIETAAQLAYLAKLTNDGQNTKGEYYKLTADIDLVAYDWTPIGSTWESGFKGQFDGNGKFIHNICIETASIERIGLFGQIKDGATLENIGVSVNIVSFYKLFSIGGLVGGLVGNSSNSIINNSYVTGNVTGGINTCAGGLIGYNGGVINNSYARVDVIVGDGNVKHRKGNTGGAASVGGLAGCNYGSIDNSYATGNVTGGDMAAVGGLVGLHSYASINNSYATGDVKGGLDADIGGISGANIEATIINAYHNGDNNGVGYNNNEKDEDTITSVSDEAMKASAETGEALVNMLNKNKGLDHPEWFGWKKEEGKNNEYPILVPMYIVTYNENEETDGKVPTAINSYEEGTQVTVLGNTGNLVREGYKFGGWNAKADGSGIDYTIGTTLTIAKENITLYAKWISNNWKDYAATGFADGDGSKDKPYQIATADQLAFLANEVNKGDLDYNAAHYELTADIDLGDHYWTPIGNDDNCFSGTFNGNEKVIHNVRIGTASNPNTTNDYIGLFGCAKKATFKNIGVSVSIVSSKNETFVGGLVGSIADATINNSYVSGNITVGEYSFVGGLVGILLGEEAVSSINNSYAIEDVRAGENSYVGGLIGGTVNSTINNSYASGNMTVVETTCVGGLVGFNYESTSTINYGYYNSNAEKGIGNGEGTVIAVSEAKIKASEFVNTLNAHRSGHDDWKPWAIVEGKNGGYPTLVNSLPVQKYTVTYNGNGNASGSVPTDNISYKEKDNVTVLGNTGNLAKVGYKLAGWNTKADGSGKDYAVGSSLTMGKANVILYAKYHDLIDDKKQRTKKLNEVIDKINIITNNGSRLTTSREIMINIENPELKSVNVKYVMISRTGNFKDAKWVEYSPHIKWMLAEGDGTKNVFIKFKDKDGNESETLNFKVKLETEDTSTPSEDKDTTGDNITFTKKNGHAYSEGQWTNEDVQFDFHDIGEVSVEDYSYSLDGGQTWENTKHGEIMEEGIKIIKYKTVDKEGNIVVYEALVKIDKTPPEGDFTFDL